MSKTTKPAEPAHVRVTLPDGKRPGVMSVGPYIPGKTYEVSAEEARRLIDSKGFEPAPAE